MTSADVVGIANCVTAAFAKRRYPKQWLEDIAQDAAVAILETYARKGLSRAEGFAYYYSAAIRKASLRFKIMRQQVTVTEHQLRAGRIKVRQIQKKRERLSDPRIEELMVEMIDERRAVAA